MIEKWEIVHNPAPKDPDRCSLLLKTDMKDLQKVIRMLGAKATRPKKANVPYNQEIEVKAADKKFREDLREFLRQISKPDAEVVRFVGGAAPAEVAAPAPPAPAAVSAAAPVSAPAAPPIAAPAQAPAAVPASAPAPTPAAPPAAVPAPAPAPAEAPAEEALPEGPTLIPATPPEFIITLRPKYNFESFVVGPFNRFAHAACMSVVDNPGTMYNPLVISGEPGVGKSHILNSMALEMSRKFKDRVVLTDAIRLAEKAAQGEGKALKDALSACEALLIDDIHLLATVDVKPEVVAGVLGDFLGHGKQVVLGSLFPPKMLGNVENMLGFKLSRGSAVDLKVASPGTAKKSVFIETSKRGGVRLGEPDFEKVVNMPQSDLMTLLEDLRLFRTFRPDQDQKELFAVLLKQGDGPPTSDQLSASLRFVPPATAPAILPLALLGPSGGEGELMFALSQVCTAAKANDIPIGFKVVLKKLYDPAIVQGLPASLAKECRAAGAGAALVLGPPPGSPAAGREKEFSHLLIHTLTANAVCTGWVPFAALGSPSAYLRVLLNLQQ